MSTVRPVAVAPDAATARRSRAERSKLRRELWRLAAICLLIAAIVPLDTRAPVRVDPAGLGRVTGSLVSLVYFVETPVWVGGSAAIMCVGVADRLLVPLEGGWRIPVALAFVWATVALLGFFTLTVALYAVPVLAIVLVVPADRLTGLTGFIDALAAVFVVYGPWAFTVDELVPLGLVLLAAFLLARTRRSPAR